MREVRRDLERQIIVIREECGGWKKKYENEARLRIEDVDMLKKKFGAQVADLSDQVNQLVNKIKQMEQQKTRYLTQTYLQGDSGGHLPGLS